MKRKEIEELIQNGREIEFSYKNKRYSITYYGDKRSNYISFCEFNIEPKDVSSVEELLALTIDGLTLEQVLNNIPNDDIDIF